MERFGADLHFMVRNHRRLLRRFLLRFSRGRWGWFCSGLIGGGGGGPLTALSLLRECTERSKKKKDGQDGRSATQHHLHSSGKRWSLDVLGKNR